ncbi:MAG: response receiver-modulated cyclic diguanylate [Geobacteraceae bacterium]|nr:MAG: response receiver-modulated cyclic diguanylate [Geobacteraceae bacterium]
MRECVLFVDDEESTLNSIERVFADNDFRLLRAGSAEAALELMNKEEIAIVVSDNMMPGMKGIELLERVAAVSPDTMKILMTAYADLPTALEAINRGEVFRFIVKPWENDVLVRTVEQGLHRYRILKAVQREDESVLRSLAQTIELKDPYTRGHCDRVAEYALMIAEMLNLPEQVKKEIKYGSWLHDCGKIGVPEAILNFAGPITNIDFETVKKHPEWGADVVREARLSETIINIVRHHHERYDGAGYPKGLSGTNIPFEARIVAVADTYDALTTNRPYRKGYHWERALNIISSMAGSALDPEIVEIFLDRIMGKQGVNVF